MDLHKALYHNRGKNIWFQSSRFSFRTDKFHWWYFRYTIWYNIRITFFMNKSMPLFLNLFEHKSRRTWFMQCNIHWTCQTNFVPFSCKIKAVKSYPITDVYKNCNPTFNALLSIRNIVSYKRRKYPCKSVDWRRKKCEARSVIGKIKKDQFRTTQAAFGQNCQVVNVIHEKIEQVKKLGFWTSHTLTDKQQMWSFEMSCPAVFRSCKPFLHCIDTICKKIILVW